MDNSQLSDRDVQDFKDTSHWVKFVNELYAHYCTDGRVEHDLNLYSPH